MHAIKKEKTLSLTLPNCIFRALLLALVVLGTAEYSHADTLKLLASPAPPYSDGSVYTYPYYFSVNGSPSPFPLMCDDFKDDVYFGESWTANVWNIDNVALAGHGQMGPAAGSLAALNGLTKAQSYVVAAYLYTELLSDLNQANSVEYNHAVWALFTSVPAFNTDTTVTGYVHDAITYTSSLTASEISNQFGNIVFFTPIDGTQVDANGNRIAGLPQEFIGRVPAPSGLALLATALVGLSAFAVRKRRSESC